MRQHRRLRAMLPRGYREYRFAGGRIYLDVRESPMMLARALGLYEPDKVDLLRRLLRPGMTFVDIGCNKGDFALIAAHVMDDEGVVHAVEPAPENCAWISRSIQSNGYRSIHLHELALSDSAGTAQLHLGEASGWHTLMPGIRNEALGAVEVRTSTLDRLLAEGGTQATADVVKIDVEGAEAAVLRGAARALAGPARQALLLDLHPPIVDPVEIGALLSSLSFRLYHPADLTRPLESLTPHQHELVALRGDW